MGEVPAIRISITNIASSNGAARLQVFAGKLPYQTLIVDCELTATQNSDMTTALAATAGTTTSFDFAAAPAALPGIANAV